MTLMTVCNGTVPSVPHLFNYLLPTLWLAGDLNGRAIVIGALVGWDDGLQQVRSSMHPCNPSIRSWQVDSENLAAGRTKKSAAHVVVIPPAGNSQLDLFQAAAHTRSHA